MTIKADLVILAGGYATRLGEQTKEIPKIMLEFGNKTFLQHQLELYDGIFNKIIFALGHLSQPVISHLNSIETNSKIAYVIDPFDGCGTGAALGNAIQECEADHIAVTYGDSYLLFDPRNTINSFIENKYRAAMVITRSTGIDKNNVEIKDGFVTRYEKNSFDDQLQYLDYGLSYFTASDVEKCDFTGAYDLSCYHNHYISNSSLHYYLSKDRYYEIGSTSGQSDFKKFLKDQK